MVMGSQPWAPTSMEKNTDHCADIQLPLNGHTPCWPLFHDTPGGKAEIQFLLSFRAVRAMCQVNEWI